MPKRNRMQRQVFNLPKRHRWKAKPGNQIFVANRGDVRFEFPGSWVFDRSSGGAGQSVRFYDGNPPNDNIRLEVSVLTALAEVAGRIPLAPLLESVTGETREGMEVIQQGSPYAMQLPNLDMAWLEMEYIDPEGKRPAFTRFCLARGSGVTAYITMDFWPEDADKAKAAWDDVLGSLRLGDYLEHPFFGPNG